MANAKKCDRCGTFYIRGAGVYRFEVKESNGIKFWNWDLCDKCHDELEEFLTGVKDRPLEENEE